MRTIQTMVLATALSAVAIGGASAQVPTMTFEVTPLVGGTLFLGELPGEFELTASDGSAVRMTGLEINDAFTLGGRAAVRFGDRFGVGATVLYSPATVTAATGAETDLGLWSYGVDASYHALTSGAVVRPFVVGGVGAKTYDFEGMDTRTDFMWNVGAGVDVALHPMATLRLEARDYMSMFDSGIASVDDKIQHDLALTAGISFRLGGRGR
jgi:opacity protein-like surface antigen